MRSIVQRAHPRMVAQIPIQVSALDSKACTPFKPASILNYSAGGFRYTTKQALPPKSQVCVLMRDYTPEQIGPGRYRSYLTRICWIHPIATPSDPNFVAGAEIVARSHEILTPCSDKHRNICDLCNALESTCRMENEEGSAQLCESCCKEYNNISPGKIRECIDRFLMGNVV